MKLLEISVANFRSISSKKVILSLEGSDIIFLFGQNNAGKSSLLSAYEYLVTPKQKATLSDFHGFDTKNKIEVIAIFLEEDGDRKIFEQKGFQKWVGSDRKIKFRKTWINVEEEGQKETFDPQTQNFEANGFGGIETHFTKQAPTPIRIPAFPTTLDLTKFIKETIQKSVLKTLKEDENEAYSKVLEEIEKLQKNILSKEIISAKSVQANKYFQRIFPELTLDISAIEGAEFDLAASLEKEFSVIILDQRFPKTRQDFSNHGHGVIRQTLFNFLGVVKNELPIVSEGEEMRKEFIILFEEPEVYLHPKSIKLCRNVLYDLCNNSQFQIISASHSPILLDISRPHTSLVRMIRNREGNTSLFQVGENIFNLSTELKEFTQMVNRFDPNICESFFADEVIIVEGDTEAIVIRQLLNSYFPTRDIYVVNAGSKTNIPFYQRIFNHFNIKQHVIHDSDTRYVYDVYLDDNGERSYKKKVNKDGTQRINPAWKLNQTIWAEINRGNEMMQGLSERFVFNFNFEFANGYVENAEEGKPLSAFKFIKNVDQPEKLIIWQFINQIAGNEERAMDYSQEKIEIIIVEPK